MNHPKSAKRRLAIVESASIESVVEPAGIEPAGIEPAGIEPAGVEPTHGEQAVVQSARVDANGKQTRTVAASGAAQVMDLLQVGELAKAAGKTVRAIHLYEDLGLLKPVNRSKGRYRLFSNDSLRRVRWITKMQNLGFSLTEIQGLVREQSDTESAMFAAAKLRQLYLDKLRETRQKLVEFRDLEAELIDSLEYLSQCDAACEAEVPANTCPNCERHPEHAKAPDLVSGVHVH